ncbi:hypothetical protein RJT34_00280 [Clitoria ternatea]|uniref:PPC domain-containing protein n=1 Tax=Clitoria ternatea TaxID=43366 RepID=A0AAN9KI21_CLITE
MAKHNNNSSNIIASSLSRRSSTSESNSISDHLSLRHHQPSQNQLDLTTPPSKKPRGRPPGSKNKPKAPIARTQHQASFIPVLITIPPGSDIIESIISYAQRHRVSVTTLSASGVLSNVTFRQTLAPSAQALTLHGPFTIMNIFGSYLSNYHHAHPSNTPTSFSITVFSNQGHALSGLVGGKVEASNEVTVLLAVSRNPKVYWVPPFNNHNYNNQP